MKFTKYIMLLRAAVLLFGTHAEAAGLETDARKMELFEVARNNLSYNMPDFEGIWSLAHGRNKHGEYQLGRIYEKWSERNHRPFTDAIAWYHRAAAQGHEEAAAALTRLGA